jgi:MFS family permease
MALSLNALVALLMLTNPFGGAGVIALFVITFFAAGNMAIDMPTRSASIPAVVGMKDLSAAIALNMIAMQGGFLFAPPLVGVLNEAFSAGQVYAGTLLTWAVIIPLIATLKYRSRGEANRSVGMLTNIKEGLAYTRRDQTLFAVILLVVVMQTLGMPGVATLGPVWMREVMDLSKSGFGAMAFTWGLGGVASLRAPPPARPARHNPDRRHHDLRDWRHRLGHHAIPLTAVANFALGFCGLDEYDSVHHRSARGSEEMRGRVMRALLRWASRCSPPRRRRWDRYGLGCRPHPRLDGPRLIRRQIVVLRPNSAARRSTYVAARPRGTGPHTRTHDLPSPD